MPGKRDNYTTMHVFLSSRFGQDQISSMGSEARPAVPLKQIPERPRPYISEGQKRPLEYLSLCL